VVEAVVPPPPELPSSLHPAIPNAASNAAHDPATSARRITGGPS
jgi:hypothetical protein